MAPFLFAPYGLGTRACLGTHLARAPMRLVTSRFVRHYEIARGRLTPGAGEQRLFHASIRRREAAPTGG